VYYHIICKDKVLNAAHFACLISLSKKSISYPQRKSLLINSVRVELVSKTKGRVDFLKYHVGVLIEFNNFVHN